MSLKQNLRQKKKTLTGIKKKIPRPYIIRKGTIQEDKMIMVMLYLRYT